MTDPTRHALINAGRRGFTLIELLIVVAIMAILFGIAFAIPWHEDREGQVRGAAEELAAVLRETRTRAIRKNMPYAVVFNIENAPGSSGKILNNRSGGHWYRVIGPNDILIGGGNGAYWTESSFHTLPFINMGQNPLNGNSLNGGPPVLRHYLNKVSRSWIDEPHRLAKGKVRFLALNDQDNGDNVAPSRGGEYSATYPRPWFGWWDSTTTELHTWGGYDPDLKGKSQKFSGWGSKSLGQQTKVNGRIASPSGFYYEGWEGEITGCVNPTDRQVLDEDETCVDIDATDRSSTGSYDKFDIARGQLYTVLKKDEPRPLINANWLDYCIVFKADGTVDDDWFRLRQAYWQLYWGSYGCRADNQDPCTVTFPTHDLKQAGLLDMCNGAAYLTNFADNTTAYPRKSIYQRESTSYVNRTGFYWITLAADAKDDASTFPTALAAMRSMLPIYRVGVNRDGQVKVIRVRTTPDPDDPITFDVTITGTDWQDKNKIWGKTGATWSANTPITQNNYVNHELRDKDLAPRGRPIFDTVLPEMLSERKWWRQP